MRTLGNIIFWMIIMCGTYGIMWPLPGFLLREDLGEAYFRFIWQLPKNDKSAGAALPFVWLFFTAPLGLFLFGVAAALYAVFDWLFPKN